MNDNNELVLPFTEISSAAVVTTTKDLFYESAEGNFEADQKELTAQAIKNYYRNQDA